LAKELSPVDCNRLKDLHVAFVEAWQLAAEQIELAAALEEADSSQAPDAVAEGIILSARVLRAWLAYQAAAETLLGPLGPPTVVGEPGPELVPALVSDGWG
jgi:hypothetical protein